MNDADIIKLAARLTETVVTKEDLKSLATKEDLKGFATKEDFLRLEKRIDKSDDKLEQKIDELNQKTDTILEFAEHIDDSGFDHEKRLRRIESIPVIAHELKARPAK